MFTCNGIECRTKHTTKLTNNPTHSSSDCVMVITFTSKAGRNSQTMQDFISVSDAQSLLKDSRCAQVVGEI